MFFLLFCFGLGEKNLFAQVGVLHISNGAKLISTNGSNVTLNNAKLSNLGEVSLTESTMHFTGAILKDSQVLVGTGFTSLGYIKVNKSVNDIQLKKSISVNRVLSLASGGIELVSGDVELSNTGELQLETPTNRVYGAGGELKSARLVTVPSAYNQANLGAVLTSSINIGNTQVYRGHKTISVNGSNSALRYYKILPMNNSGLNATLKFNYFDQELNGVNESDMQIWYSTDNGTTWIQTKASQRDATANFIETNKLNQMAWFTIAPPCTPLLTSLTRYISIDQVYFFKGQNRNTTGITIDSLLTKIGCDSFITLHLFVKPMSALPNRDTIVRGQTFFTLNGKTYTTNQIVRDTLRGPERDSIRVYNVMINIPKVIPATVVECQNFYTWRRKKYTQNGIYRDTVSQKLTDTVYELNLTLKNMNLSVSYKNGEFISNCTSCKRFQWYLCNADGTKSKIINATNRTFKTITEGEYSVEIDGVDNCTGQSPCVNKLTALSINSAQNMSVSVYPNPFQNQIFVSLDKYYAELDLNLIDMMGKVLFSKKVYKVQELELEMQSYSKGNYILQLQTKEGTTSTIKLTKE